MNIAKNETRKVLVINGSYRDDGITDQAVEVAVEILNSAGVAVEVVLLRDYSIEFCLNCRHCTQIAGDSPGKCVHEDGMQALVNKIEQADAFILASPTNFGSVTAIFKRFLERLVVYAYWPWGNNYPQFRKAKTPTKRAMLISSSAAPAFFGRWLNGSIKQLNTAAKTIGAKSVGTLFTGMISNQVDKKLPQHSKIKTRSLALKLIASD